MFSFYRPASKSSTGSAQHPKHLSSPSTMTLFSPYFSSVGRVLSRKMNMAKLCWGIEARNAGGTGPRRFAEDGDTSYLTQPPTWAFALFVPLPCP